MLERRSAVERVCQSHASKLSKYTVVADMRLHLPA